MTENLPAIPTAQPSLTLVQQGRTDLVDPATDSWTAVVRDIATFAQQICDTEFVPKGMQGRPDKVTAAMMYGREIGLPPMNSLATIHVINGKAGISAEVMRSMVMQAGHEFEVTEKSSARVTVRGRRRGSQNWLSISWTQEDAKQAGLLSNNTYKSYPRQMLMARATTELCRDLFPDVIHGLHSTEELEAMPADQPDVEQAAAQVEAPKRRTVQRRKPTTQPAPAQQQVEEPAQQPAPARQSMPLPAPARQDAALHEQLTGLWLRVLPELDAQTRMAWISETVGRPVQRLGELTSEDAETITAALDADQNPAEQIDQETGEVKPSEYDDAAWLAGQETQA